MLEIIIFIKTSSKISDDCRDLDRVCRLLSVTKSFKSKIPNYVVAVATKNYFDYLSPEKTTRLGRIYLAGFPTLSTLGPKCRNLVTNVPFFIFQKI